uniref:Zinc finger, CCHC-type n=1 Tax=Tanacetum cinerariifolium TaxID=118510 RepID=A0A6L2JFP9_TANCI|nr:hypothetical protein [Tanacetum cinerariifolium]
MALNNAQTKTNSSAFKSMLEKHQLTGPNFNEWFRALKLVVRTEKSHDVFETALPPAPTAGADAQALADWAVLFYRHNEVACLMLGTMSPKLYQEFKHNSPLEMVTELQKMYEKPSVVELQELVNMFHSCKQSEGQSVSDHVLLMKSYLDQLATLNYAFLDKVFISFILNSLSSKFQAFVQNYNMQSIEKTIMMAIQGGRVQNYKPQGKAKGIGKGKGPQNSYPTKPKKPQPYKKERLKKTRGQNVASTSLDIYTIELSAFPKNSWVYDTGCESAARILNMVPTKKVDKTPYELWHGKVSNLSYLKVCRFLGKGFHISKGEWKNSRLEDEDILPSKNTSEHPIEEESLTPIVSQEEDVIPVRRSLRTHKASDRLYLNVEIDPDQLCFNVEVEEHILGDLNEPANYKAALSNPEFEKWLVAMNTKMQSMYDNKVWRLVVLPPNAKVVKSKWIYKKKTDMDGKSHELTVIAMLDSKPIKMKRNLKLEAEYIAAKEAVWIRKFIDELGVVPSNDYPIKMNCDKSAAIIMAKESGIQEGARHFKRKYHYVPECIETGEIDIVKVHTDAI